MKLASFDIFDTLLTRTVAEPDALFLLLGRKLGRCGLINISAEAFARARIEAELNGRRNCKTREVTLDAVYAELAPALHLNDEQRRVLSQEELELETELLRPVPDAAARLAAARIICDRIAFVSDTYFPAHFIRRELQRCGFLRNGDLLYLSCEEQCSKWNGQLYAKLLSENGLKGHEVSHHGNNRHSDVRRARRAGVRAIHLPEANLNRYERALAANAWATEGLSASMAGASRLARLSVPANDQREAALRDVAAGVAGPVLCSFVLWALGMAKRLGLKHLYFLARDGQVLYEIARRLKPKLSIDCELHYFYCSRQACHLPSLTDVGKRELGWVFDGVPLPTVRRALSRLALTPEEIAQELQTFGIRKEDWENTATAALADVLQFEPVRHRVMERAAAKRKNLSAYLQQEGLFLGEPYAFVDTGWVGRLQDSIARVLALDDAPPPVGLYLGLHKRDIKPSAGQQHAFFFEGQQRTGYNDLASEIMIMAEMFCMADHGMTVDYQSTSQGQITPVLKTTANSSAWDWGAAKVRETVVAFAERLYLDENSLDPYAGMRQTIAGVIAEFWRHPTRPEALAWGSFPYEDDQSGDVAVKIAARYRLRDICSGFFRGSLPRPHAAGWASGAWRLSPLPLRATVSATAYLGRTVRRAVPRRLHEKLEARVRGMYRQGWFDRVPRVKAFLHVLAS